MHKLNNNVGLVLHTSIAGGWALGPLKYKKFARTVFDDLILSTYSESRKSMKSL